MSETRPNHPTSRPATILIQPAAIEVMFNPSPQDVRRFFCETFRKYNAKEILTPLEAIARDWVIEHREYATILSNAEEAIAADYSIERGQQNPFLHLSMHLSIAEQVSIDQPPGIRAASLALAQRLGSEHEAHHQIMECLGEMIWTSQRDGLPPDGAAYIECIRKR
ncbi:DUF1841 family protein [soil metagenome]